ncbi:MAG: zinc ribbon domain-containing protein [Dehalococcoidia bacterium]|nr:MAG: zinc ribbon domain-containing protein [Dehalococcoidia bacterium]
MLQSPCSGKMPVYEYICDSCHQIVSSYRQRFAVAAPSCPRCGSNELRRIFSVFSVQRTYTDVYEDILSDRQLTQGMMRNDPRALAEWSRRMSSGEKSPPEYEELTERMEKGEWPSGQIEEKREELFGQERGKPESD